MRTVSDCRISDLGAMLTLVRAAIEVCQEWKQDWKRIRSEYEVKMAVGGCAEEREQQVALEEECWVKKECVCVFVLSWEIVDPMEKERLII